MDNHLSLMADFLIAQQLEKERQHDPQAIALLIQIYERFVGQLVPAVTRSERCTRASNGGCPSRVKAQSNHPPVCTNQ